LVSRLAIRFEDRVKGAFRRIKKTAKHNDFMESSTGVFHKIGLATLMIIQKRIDEKNLILALKKMKKLVKKRKKEDKRIKLLRKKFHIKK